MNTGDPVSAHGLPAMESRGSTMAAITGSRFPAPSNTGPSRPADLPGNCATSRPAEHRNSITWAFARRADANERRDWRIHAALAHGSSPGEDAVRDDWGWTCVYALDSTTTHFRTTKAAVKMHTLLDLRGNIPSFIHISDGKLPRSACSCRKPEPWIVATPTLPAFMCCTKSLLRQRAKSNIDAHRVYSAPTDRSTGTFATSDGFYTRQDYPGGASASRTPVRQGWITNNFSLPAATICALYKRLAGGKWIKQHLRIQFYGTRRTR